MLQSNQKIICHKVNLPNLAEQLGKVSKACQMMGLPRDAFYPYHDAQHLASAVTWQTLKPG